MSDVWPRRNLGTAENWGRTVENRFSSIRRKAQRQSQSQNGLDRYSTATAGSLASLIDSIRAAIQALPVPFTRSSSSAGFGFGGSWQTVASVRVRNPGGHSRVNIDAIGSCTSYQEGSVSVRFIWPFSLDYVTSEFGPRPPLPYHNGIDFSYGGISGTAIPASHEGVVILRGSYSDWGNYTRIDCTPLTGISNSWTGYAHMNSPGIYAPGTMVSQGQTIGYVGNTGESTGPHLHFETATVGSRMNPRTFMDTFAGGTVSLQKVTARLVVNGSESPEFEPYRGDDVPRSQANFPIWGASLSGSDPDALVELQIRASGSGVPAHASNTASLTVKGSFEQ